MRFTLVRLVFTVILFFWRRVLLARFMFLLEKREWMISRYSYLPKMDYFLRMFWPHDSARPVCAEDNTRLYNQDNNTIIFLWFKLYTCITNSNIFILNHYRMLRHASRIIIYHIEFIRLLSEISLFHYLYIEPESILIGWDVVVGLWCRRWCVFRSKIGNLMFSYIFAILTCDKKNLK